MYQDCYSIKDQLKHAAFDRFWKILWQLELRARKYSRQILYAFNKLAELFFDKRKSHNPFLIAEIRIILSTIEYDEEPEIAITIEIFQIGILLKRLRLFTSTHIDQQLLDEARTSLRERDAQKRSPNPVQLFSNIFKRRNSAVSETSNLLLLLELDANMKHSKNQHQVLKIRKFFFEAFDLSKHPIKNL